MALDATPGLPTSNAYVDVAGATALLAERLYTDAWTTADPAEQEAALIWATRLLDEQVRWVGLPTYPDQALGWPRSGVLDRQGRTVDATTIPLTIQRATAFYALDLLQDPTEQSGGVAAGTVKMQKLGDTTIEYFQPGTTGAILPKAASTTLPAEIRQMLTGWGLIPGGVVVSLLRA